MPAQQGAVATRFGVPGFTRPTEQRENDDQTALAPVAGSVQPVGGLLPFKQTDVIRGWRFEWKINATYAAGTTTLNKSQYFPNNFFGAIKLQYQNQWAPINVISQVDAAMFQLIRPFNYGEVIGGRSLLDTAYGTFANYSAQTNIVSNNNFGTGSTSFYGVFDVPASLDFDRYWNLDPQGRPTHSTPYRCTVTPQLMAGSARIVQPSLSLNGLIVSGAGTSDIYPIYASGTQTTPGSVSGISGTLGIQRYGWYQPQTPADTPVIWPWQYTRTSTYQGIGGKSIVDLPIPLNGQILSVFVRLYDPAANVISTVAYGAPISVDASTPVTKCELRYGSGLYRFQDTPLSAQERFGRQHGVLPLPGVIAWDMALGNTGLITNEECLNTMTQSGVTAHLEFSSAVSSSAYAVLGVEALAYVPSL